MLIQEVDGCEMKLLEAKLTHGEDSKEQNRVSLDLGIVLCSLALVLTKEVTMKMQAKIQGALRRRTIGGVKCHMGMHIRRGYTCV